MTGVFFPKIKCTENLRSEKSPFNSYIRLLIYNIYLQEYCCLTATACFSLLKAYFYVA